MKHLNLIFLAIIFTLASCGEKEDLANTTVIKTCEGTFLQMENTYYQVCNEDILSTVESGTELNLNVKHLDDCDEHEIKDCSLVDPIITSDEWVEVIYTY